MSESTGPQLINCLPPPPPRFVDARELARRLSVPVGLIYRLSSEGRLPKLKLGHRTVRFDYFRVLDVFGMEPPDGVPADAPDDEPRSGGAAQASTADEGDDLDHEVKRILRSLPR